MRHLFLLFIFAPFVLYAQDMTVPSGIVNRIKSKHLKETMKVLTSDSLEGRAVGFAGAEKSAKYIEKCFRDSHLLPFEGSYHQQFDLWKTRWSEVYIKMGDRRLSEGEDFIYIGRTTQSEETNRQVVFLGEVNDTSQIQVDLNDKIALVVLNNLKSTISKFSMLQKRGAWAVFGVSTDNEQYLKMSRDYFAFRENLSISKSKPLISESGSRNFILSASCVQKMFGKSLEELLQLSDTVSSNFPVCELTLKLKKEVVSVPAYNVLGIIEGKDNRHTIAVTAHYDHIGRNREGQICRGADDNASGVSCILAMAKALKRMKDKPQYNILFIAFSGEEIGLLGSSYFMDNETPDEFIANINIDMIGRRDTLSKNNYVYLMGPHKWPWVGNLVRFANAATENLTIDEYYDVASGRENLMMRSDHYPFYRNNIPIASFFSGLHGDYHTPRDTYERIDFPLFTKRTRLILATLLLMSKNHVEFLETLK